VIVQIARQPDIKISELALLVGVTERHARAIVNDLRDTGYLEVQKTGRRNSYRVNTDLNLRHSAESDHQLRDLLAIFDSPSTQNSR
jgi:DNA-binding transcriptional regulator PaaX